MASISDRPKVDNNENITVVWFDPKVNGKSDRTAIMKTLRTITHHILVYTDLVECFSYIESTQNKRIFLVVSGTWAWVVLPPIINLKQLEVVYILSTKREQHLHLMEKYPKISGIFVNQKEFDSSIRKHVPLSNQRMEIFTLSDQNQNVSINLSELTPDFLWLQFYHNVILCLSSNNQAKQEMIDTCRQYYQGSENNLQQIDNFEKFYTSKDCIRWYTQETFVYKIVNKAIQTEDMQQLFLFRFYISDLSIALAWESKNRQRQEDHDGAITTVYRGVRLTMNELKQLQSNEGKLISINGYLSASRLRDVALKCAADFSKRNDSIAVLLEIECPEEEEEENGSIFADIAKYSISPEEQEVLFDLAAIFRVERVSEGNDMWTIHLSATEEGQEIVRQYIEETKKEMKEDSVVILFGSLMTRIGHYQQAETYFRQLSKYPGKENLANIHNQLGLVYQIKAKFDQAIHHFHIAYDLMKKSSPTRLQDSIYVLRNMSHVLIEQGYYKKALEYSNKAMHVLKDLSDEYQLERAHCFHSIGSCYLGLRQYDEALDYYEQALNIKRTYLPEDHAYIAETLNSIGLVHLKNIDTGKALSYFTASLAMYQLCIPGDHPDIANVLHNVADIFLAKREYDKALQHYQLALAIKEKCFSPYHPSIAATLNNMSTVLCWKGEKEKALELSLKALEIRDRILPIDHLDVATSLSSVGHKYEAINENQLALSYFEKALEIQARVLPIDHPIRKKTERCVILIKRKLT